MEADYIYWTDVFHNSINRARRSDGSEQIKIVDNAASVTDVKVISKSDISRRGMVVNVALVHIRTLVLTHIYIPVFQRERETREKAHIY